MASSSGRVPQGEVIIDFADGGSYIKNKLEDAVVDLERRRIEKDEAAKAKRAAEALKIASGEQKPLDEGDVATIVRELSVSKDVAEDSLREANGDVVKALVSLVSPPRKA